MKVRNAWLDVRTAWWLGGVVRRLWMPRRR
jgi:hypothetical protein